MILMGHMLLIQGQSKYKTHFKLSHEAQINFKVRGPFVQTLCIEKVSYMYAI